MSNKNLNDIFCCLQLIPFRSGAVVKEVKRQRVKNHELITNNEHRSKNLIFYKIHTDDKNDGKKTHLVQQGTQQQQQQQHN